jgi:hypothetical protein
MTAQNVLELPLARRYVVEAARDIPVVKASRVGMPAGAHLEGEHLMSF